jgi:esterase
MQVQDKTITLNGLRFHYRDWGDPSNSPLIVLHGFLGHARMYDPLGQVMSERYRVLALDQRGHGETEWASAYGPDLVFDDVASFVERLGLSQVSILGYSFSGPIGYTYAARYPERVDRLVLMESGATAGTPSPRAMAQMQAWATLPRTFDTPQDAQRAFFDVVPRAARIEFQRFVQDGLTQQSDGRWTWRWDPKLLQARLPPPPDFMWRTLPQVICPTLYVRGEDSEYVPLDLAERMVAVIPHGQLVNIPNAGNFSWFENPTAVMEVVRDFLVPR